jgi:hypothetical protein
MLMFFISLLIFGLVLKIYQYKLVTDLLLEQNGWLRAKYAAAVKQNRHYEQFFK